MARTQLTGQQVLDGSVQRADLDTTTAASALITKVIADATGGLAITSTGVDSGTGDVTISIDATQAAGNYIGTSCARFLLMN